MGAYNVCMAWWPLRTVCSRMSVDEALRPPIASWCMEPGPEEWLLPLLLAPLAQQSTRPQSHWNAASKDGGEESRRRGLWLCCCC